MQEEKSNALSAVSKLLLLVLDSFKESIWTHCKNQDSESGHEFRSGNVYIKDSATKTFIAGVQCTYCGKVVFTEFKAEMPNYSRMMPPASREFIPN